MKKARCIFQHVWEFLDNERALKCSRCGKVYSEYDYMHLHNGLLADEMMKARWRP